MTVYDWVGKVYIIGGLGTIVQCTVVGRVGLNVDPPTQQPGTKEEGKNGHAFTV